MAREFHPYYDNPLAHPYADALKEQKVVLIGGGGGNSLATKALLPYVKKLVSVVAVSDSGGATGKNSAEHGVIPTGDISRVTAAMSRYPAALRRFDGKEARLGPGDSPETVREIGKAMIADLQARGHQLDKTTANAIVDHAYGAATMAKGGVTGRKVSGLMYTGAMSPRLMGLDANTATEKIGHMVGAQGEVWAATDLRHHIVLQDGDTRVVTEDDIDNYTVKDPLNATLSFDTKLRANPKASAAVVEADWSVYSQGSIWGSELPPAMVMAEALAEQQRRGGKVGGVVNLLQDNGTLNVTAAEHGQIMERHTGIPLDFSIYSDNPEAIPPGFAPVQGMPEAQLVVPAHLAGGLAEYSANDAVAAAGLRSPLETDPRALALAMMDLVQMQYEGALAAA